MDETFDKVAQALGERLCHETLTGPGVDLLDRLVGLLNQSGNAEVLELLGCELSDAEIDMLADRIVEAIEVGNEEVEDFPVEDVDIEP